MKIFFLATLGLFPLVCPAQDFGKFPDIKKEKLLGELEILYQALDKYHSGMYWYTPRDSVDLAFAATRELINRDMNVLEFHKLIAPLVGLSKEDHTDIYLPEDIKEEINDQATFLPITIVFLGRKLYCVKNGSDQDFDIEGKEITKINGLTPTEIVDKTGSLFASDGFIKTVKFSDLEGFSFSRYYYYYFGNIDLFQIQIKNSSDTLKLKPLKIEEIKDNLNKRYPNKKDDKEKESLEFKLLNDSIAYLGIHSFSNSRIKNNPIHNNYRKFLDTCFDSVKNLSIPTLIIDVSKNGGGTEGNEGILYSYLGENYQKYKAVRAKAQKVTLNNGTDEPITLKTFGFFERVFGNKKMPDGSYTRRKNARYGLMAYKKEPHYKFKGKVYVIIGPVTYSGGSEFANMMYTRNRGIFVGEETGGGYYGNTSGYSREVTLPHSQITVDIPALQFIMNVEGLSFGSGVIPHYEVIPTFKQYTNNENAPLQFILDLETKK